MPDSLIVPAQDGNSGGATDSSAWRRRSGCRPSSACSSKHRRAGRPRLRARGRRIGDRERRLRSAHPREDLRQLVVEVLRGGEHPLDDTLRLGPARVAREPGGDDRVVVRPDRAVVVRERVVAGVRRSTSCARPSPTRARRPSAGRRRRRRAQAGRCRSRAGVRCWSRASRPSASRRRARARRSRRALRPRTPRRSACAAPRPPGRGARRAHGRARPRARAPPMRRLAS